MKETIFDFPLDQIRRRSLRFVSAAVATEYINDEPVKPGNMQIVSRIAIENKTNAYTKFRIGVWDGADFHLLYEQKSPLAATLYSTADAFYLSEGENLRIELVGCVLNDIVFAYVDGFLKCGNYQRD